jgi:hypothetical protein
MPRIQKGAVAEPPITPPPAEPDPELEAYVPPPPRLEPPDPKRKPVTRLHSIDAPWMSGFCANEAQLTGALADQAEPGAAERIHARCPGAVTSGNGTTTICGCPGHQGEHRCHICGHVSEGGEGFDLDRRRCTDIEACAERLHTAAIAAANTPLSRMLREVKASARRGESNDSTVPVSRAPSARRVGRPCQCGCAALTGGGIFRPGHDAKLKSVLQKAAAGGDLAAGDELVARHWPRPPGRVANVDTFTPEAAAAYITKRVAERYENMGDQQSDDGGADA